MNNDFENNLSRILSENKTSISRDHILTSTLINTKRIMTELKEIEKHLLSETHTDIFSMLILGSQLENLKREFIKIKKDYLKKW